MTKINQRINVKDYTACQIAAMKRRMAILEEENQIFRRSGCGTSASIDEKVAAVKQLQDNFSIHAICRTLNLTKGTYYNRLYRTPAETVFEQRNDELSSIIKEIFEVSNGRFGANMIHVKMREQGIVVSRKHVKTLMNRMQLVSRQMPPVLFNTRSRRAARQPLFFSAGVSIAQTSAQYASRSGVSRHGGNCGGFGNSGYFDQSALMFIVFT